ncbi:MAG: type II secretion system F family protein [Candidatus Eisenbacteria bacterium]
MPLFTYRAVTEEGVVVQGMEEAASAIEAARQITDRRLMPVDVAETRAKEGLFKRLGFRRRVPAALLSRLFGNIESLLDAGIPLTSSLHLVADQLENRRLASALEDIAFRVEHGKTFAEAVQAHRDVIPTLFASLIRAGEESGKLPEVMNRLVEYVERESETKRKVTEAMIYPCIVLVIGVSVTTLILVYMVPRFVGILESSGVPLPGPTKVLMMVSSGLRRFGLYGLGGIVAGGVVLSRMLRRRRWRLVRDRTLLAIPLLGDLIRKAAIARFSKTLGTLLGSGVPLLPALELVGPTYGNRRLEEANHGLLRSIEGGSNLTGAIRKEDVFPRMVVEMVAVGESTGTLDRMLQKIGGFYDKEVERATRRMTLALEPALIVVLGVVVGYVALALILPMLKAVSSLG